MTTNRDLAATWTYHNGTKHSLQSVRNDPHYLDWENQPLPFKIYSALEPLPLPHVLPPAQIPTLTALSATRVEQRGAGIPDVPALAAILFLSAGITKRRPYPGGEIYFRAAACTGALYHIDLYLVCGDLPGLPPVSITSGRTILPYDACGRVIIVAALPRPAGRSRRSRTRR